MDTRFKHSESLAAGTQRILETELVAALEQLRLPPERRDEGIHECRKCLKYARALLRLVAEGMPGRAFSKWNRTLRNAARCISDVRDAKAVLECLDALAAESGPDAVNSGAFEACRQALTGQAASAKDAAAEADAAAEKAFLLISGLLTTPHDPGLGRGREALVLREGLRCSHALGRRAMAQLRKTGSIEAAHEWRKRAKDLRYQVAMVHETWPGMCAAMEGELHRLTDCLGRVHDLHLLDTVLGTLPEGAVSGASRAALRARAAVSAEAATAEALRLGERLYGGKPGAFADRVAGWWVLWREEPPRPEKRAEQAGEGAVNE